MRNEAVRNWNDYAVQIEAGSIYAICGALLILMIGERMLANPPPKQCASPGPLLGQEIGNSETGYFIIGGFPRPSLMTVSYPFRKGGVYSVPNLQGGCIIWEGVSHPFPFVASTGATAGVREGNDMGGQPLRFEVG